MQMFENHDMAKYTTFQVGGPARYYCRPKSSEEASEALRFAKNKRLPVFILGGGANVLISDRGYGGLVIHTAGLNNIYIQDRLLTAGAGTPVSELTTRAFQESLSGLEFAGGLPGSAGGAAYMNARCYGHSFCEIIDSVSFLTMDGEERQYNNEELRFDYKYSALMDFPCLILQVNYLLKTGVQEQIRIETDANRKDREKKGQYEFPSAGCFFKNDHAVGIPAGKIIEDLGMKGLRVGGAEVYQRHANFLVNSGKATAEDLKKLSEAVKKKTLTEKGIRLEEEVTLIGFEDE